jgi:poly(3-hydroxybutyrate) depolymerase
MYEPAGRQFPSLAFLWPAFAAASASNMAALIAKHFADLAVGPAAPPVPAPKWSTPHRIALELKMVRLRDFSAANDGSPALVCAPFTLHGAVLADLAPGHSLVAALLHSGLRRLFLADWRSATADMRFLGIDDYLAALNVLVDHIGDPVDLIGLSQGGWMALVYAARFPMKVRKLVLAAASVDITAGSSALSMLAKKSPPVIFHELVRFGDGLVLGRKVLKFWAPEAIAAEDVQQLLQTEEPIGSAAFSKLETLFRNWYAWTIDLPGTFFLETVEKVYKRNELATGDFIALGQRIDLGTVRAPLFMLAARDDELAAPQQLFAAEHLVSTAPQNLHKAVAPCRHVGLFMGKRTLEDVWPSIVRWIREPPILTPDRVETQSAAQMHWLAREQD